jgi:hypothetical protein
MPLMAMPTPEVPSFSAADGRMLIRLTGRLDEERLQRFVTDLKLTRRGRLGDREDAEFGYRVLADGRAELGLWRHDGGSWSVTLDYRADAATLVDEVRAWVTRAAAAAGVTVESQRNFPPQGDQA